MNNTQKDASPGSSSTTSPSPSPREEPKPDPSFPPLVELPSIIQESITLLGSQTAILLQVGHPSVGQGVTNHSDFVYRTLDRAEKTSIYIYAMVFGSPEEKAAVKSWVDRVHSRVKGVRKDEEGEGKMYNAQDPELQLWVAATMYVAMVGVYEMVYGPLEKERAERVYREFRVYATALQVPEGMWPEDIAAFKEYFARTLEDEVRVVPETKKLFGILLGPKVPIFLRPLVWHVLVINRAIAGRLLPKHKAENLGLGSSWPSRWFGDLMLSSMTAVYPWYPAFVRHYPKKIYMAKMRRMIKQMKKREELLAKL